MSDLSIPYDVADRITLCCLQNQLKYLKEEVRLHTEEGHYLHPEDYNDSITKLIPALEALIPYFGGNL